jgi:integrase
LPSDIKVLLREMQDDGVGAYTRKRTLTTLKSALRQLVLEEELERNPCDPIKPPKVTPKDFHVPTPAEIKLLLTLAKPFWLLALLLVSFTCTMRSGEIFALYWTQVDLDEGTIDVNKSLAVGWDKKVVRKAPKNKYSRRIIYMPAVTVAALRKLTSDQAKEGYGGPWVFPNEVGGPLQKNNFRSRHWVPLLRKAGLQYVKPYAGRHAGNSILISQGEDPLAIARRMGQADTRMAFDVYGHLFEGFGRRSASRMEKGLEEAGIKPGAFDL